MNTQYGLCYRDLYNKHWWWRARERFILSTLESIGNDGARSLYGGDVGAALVKDLRAKGGRMALSDLSEYKPAFAEPLDLPYHGGRIYAATRGGGVFGANL